MGQDAPPLGRYNLDYYYVFPAYDTEFRNMDRWLAHWREAFPEGYRFWPGFSGGGILAVPLGIPERERNSLALANAACHHKPISGLVLGNESGRDLVRYLSCAISYRPPMLAVRMRIAERVPDPTVAVTAEHADGLDGRRYLLVAPKANRRSIKLMEQLPSWFGNFGVTIGPAPTELPPALREAMRDWFVDPGRPMFTLPMGDGEANAAWQLAVTYYVAEHWDIQARGLDSVHFVADIEGRPNFRRNWTSNR